MKIRDFAVGEGVAPELLDGITDPVDIKFIDDYRRLKHNVSKGQAKRKSVPKRAVPTKKSAPPAKKKQVAEMLSARKPSVKALPRQIKMHS